MKSSESVKPYQNKTGYFGGADLCVNEKEIEVGIEAERVGVEKEDKNVKSMIDPLLPTKEEVERHYVMGHIPFRNWCPVCVRSKVREMDHTQLRDKERIMPEYHFDYCFAKFAFLDPSD